MSLKNYKDLLDDLGEVNDASDLINEILNTYEMRKKLLNKLLVSEYLVQTNIPTVIVANNDDQIEKSSDIEVLKGILDKVKNTNVEDDDDKRQIVGTTTQFKDFKELLESRELIEKICRVLIENDDFRELFKTSINEIKMEKPVENSKKGREIKLQFQINNNNNNNSDNKCCIGIANCLGNSKSEKYFERKQNQKRKLDDTTKNEDTVENQAKKLKSILQNAKIEDADSNQDQQQQHKYILPKKNASI